MSRRIARLLNDSQEAVAAKIAELEAAVGHHGEDIRLLTHNDQRAKEFITLLGLDPADTTAEELYYALQAKYASDSQMFESALGLDEQSAADQRLEVVADLFRSLMKGTERMFLKKTVAKQLLADNKPVRTKKLLGYRSLDSMLKREKLGLVYSLLSYETASWQKRFDRSVRKLDSSAYELRAPDINVLSDKTCKELKLESTLVLADKRLGSLTVAAAGQPSALELSLTVIKAAQDLLKASLLQKLTLTNPALAWWHRTANLAAWIGEEVVSFNLFDVDSNHSKDFSRRVHSQVAGHLWNELIGRYESRLADDLGQTLEAQPAEAMLTPEELDG